LELRKIALKIRVQKMVKLRPQIKTKVEGRIMLLRVNQTIRLEVNLRVRVGKPQIRENP